MKIILLVGDDNQIYQALVSESGLTQTLADSKSGPMTFTPLEDDDGPRP